MIFSVKCVGLFLWLKVVCFLAQTSRALLDKFLLSLSKINVADLKGTLHSKLTLFFSWPKGIYYFELSLTSFTFVKLELKVQGTHFYGDAGEFDGRRGINLGICRQLLYHGTDD